MVLASIHKQLMASHTNTKVVGAKRINVNSEVDSTRVVGAEWVPQQKGQYFVVGHFSGKVYLYSKVRRSKTYSGNLFCTVCVMSAQTVFVTCLYSDLVFLCTPAVSCEGTLQRMVEIPQTLQLCSRWLYI